MQEYAVIRPGGNKVTVKLVNWESKTRDTFRNHQCPVKPPKCSLWAHKTHVINIAVFREK